jgi:hypothetical protein
MKRIRAVLPDTQVVELIGTIAELARRGVRVRRSFGHGR